MKLTNDVLRLNLPVVETKIKQFIKNYVENCESEGVVLGLSGGLDSSTTAALAALSRTYSGRSQRPCRRGTSSARRRSGR